MESEIYIYTSILIMDTIRTSCHRERRKLTFNPFPHTANLQQTTLKSFKKKYSKYILFECSWNHCGKWRNSSLWELFFLLQQRFQKSPLQRCQKASSCGKGSKHSPPADVSGAFAQQQTTFKSENFSQRATSSFVIMF